MVDISARKAAEEEARHRREQIELLGRASLLGEMTASLAHELNQPLSAIMSNANAGMLFIEKGKVEADSAARNFPGRGGRQPSRSRDHPECEERDQERRAHSGGRINVNQIVETVAHLVQPDALAHFCTVETALAENLPPVEGDPSQLQQVLINLVSNAFMPCARRRRTGAKCTSRTSGTAAGWSPWSVRDHGHGIAEAAREHLFEQFFTTKQEGLGMGLAIVRSIVEAHGGRIEAENVDGGGAHFRFHLPAAPEEPV